MSILPENFGVCQSAALFLGILLDFLLGDPKKYHLIILIGRLITALEARLRKALPNSPRAAGTLLLVLSLLITVLPAAAMLIAAFRVSVTLAICLEALLNWQLLAARSLQSHSMAVSRALRDGDLEAARLAVSMIVGRDTDALDASGVARAATESVAENTSDGVIAPMFYIMLLGPVGGLAYKVVNTLDSMVGYTNEKYLDFGRASAKTDDAANFLPSRLSALLMLAAALFLGFDARSAWRIFRRDRKNHESPNSGQPESVLAGALNIRLGGPVSYGGVLKHRRYIGDDIRPVTSSDIYSANLIMLIASGLMALIFLVFTLLLF